MDSQGDYAVRGWHHLLWQRFSCHSEADPNKNMQRLTSFFLFLETELPLCHVETLEETYESFTEWQTRAVDTGGQTVGTGTLYREVGKGKQAEQKPKV